MATDLTKQTTIHPPTTAATGSADRAVDDGGDAGTKGTGSAGRAAKACQHR